MKLTREQFEEIWMASHFGLMWYKWEGVTDRPWWELSEEDQSVILAAVRSASEEATNQMDHPPHVLEMNRKLLESWYPAALREEEAKWRKHLLGSEGRRPSLTGLRGAVNETLSHVKFWSDTQKLAVERRLAAGNLPNLVVLSAMLRKKHEGILKRGKVRNEEEYYLVQEIISMADYPIDEESRQRLETLAGDFASRPRSTKPAAKRR